MAPTEAAIKIDESIVALEGSQRDVDVKMENLMKGIAKTVQASALTAAEKIAEKYNKMFEDLEKAAKHSEDITDKMVQFANRFRPMNNQALRYVLKLKGFSQAMRKDKIKTIQEALGQDDPDIGMVSEVVEEITESFKPLVDLFHTVRDGYGELTSEANQLSLVAQQQQNSSEKQKTTAEIAKDAGEFATGVSGGGALVCGACWIGNGSLAAWATAPACVVIGPLGWMSLVGIGGVAGIAAWAGGAEAEKAHRQIIKDMEMVTDVMNDIVLLVNKHCAELELICETLTNIKEDAEILDKTMRKMKENDASGKSIRLPCNRANRQLESMSDDCTKLEASCDKYIETEKNGQKGVWNIVNKK